MLPLGESAHTELYHRSVGIFADDVERHRELFQLDVRRGILVEIDVDIVLSVGGHNIPYSVEETLCSIGADIHRQRIVADDAGKDMEISVLDGVETFGTAGEQEELLGRNAGNVLAGCVGGALQPLPQATAFDIRHHRRARRHELVHSHDIEDDVLLVAGKDYNLLRRDKTEGAAEKPNPRSSG